MSEGRCTESEIMNNLIKNPDHTQLQVLNDIKNKIMSHIPTMASKNCIIIKSKSSLTGLKDIDLIIPLDSAKSFFHDEFKYYYDIGKVGHIKSIKYVGNSIFPHFLMFDLNVGGLSYKGCPYLKWRFLQNNVERCENVYILNEKAQYFDDLFSLILSDKTDKKIHTNGYYTEFIQYLKSYNLINNKEYSELSKNHEFNNIYKLRKVIKARFIFKNLQNFIIHYVGKIRNLKNIFRHKYSICFIGVDGAGKSTIIDSLAYVFQPFFRVNVTYMGWKHFSLPPIRLYRYIKYSLIKHNNKEDTSEPKGVGKLELVATFFELYFRYIKSQLNPRTDLILFDRYFYDQISRSKNNKIKSLMYKVIPKPDNVFFLNAPVDVLYERKQEANKKVLLTIQNILKNEQANIGFIEINTAENNIENILSLIINQIGEDVCKVKREL